MKWKNFVQILSVFCLLALLNGYVLNQEALVAINKISVKPEKLNTLVMFETSAPPAWRAGGRRYRPFLPR